MFEGWGLYIVVGWVRSDVVVSICSDVVVGVCGDAPGSSICRFICIVIGRRGRILTSSAESDADLERIEPGSDLQIQTH